MSFDGVKVNKLNGGLNRQEPTDDAVALLVYVVATADLPAGRAHYAAHELLQTSDAEALGYNASWDTNELKLVHAEIEEFFRIAPAATLFLMAVPDALTPVAIMQAANFKAVLRANQKIKGIGIAGTSETVQSLAALVENVQAEVAALELEHINLDYVILCGKGEAAPIAVSAYNDLRTKNAPNVSVSIAQDPYMAGLNAAHTKYAAIGAVLGGICVRQVNENLGSVDILNKPDAYKANPDYRLSQGDKWASANLSDGTKVSTLSLADQKSLTAKGYIIAGTYNGYPGVYFDDSPTAVQASSDYAKIEYNRTWNKAKRGIRKTMMPKVKSTIKKDPATGYIRPTAIKQLENLAKKPLDAMEKADEISGYSVYIDPKQIVNETSPLKVKAKVVVDDIAHVIAVDLGLSNKL